MEKRIILFTLLIVFNAQLISAQLMSEHMIFWELYKPESSKSFADSLSAIDWPKNEFAYRIKHEHLNINNQKLIFSYVSGCSGLPCMFVYCFKENNGKWYFVAQGHIMKFDKSVSAYFNDNNGKIFFIGESHTELGSVGADFLLEGNTLIDSESTNVLLTIGDDRYVIDIDRRIKFKIASDDVSLFAKEVDTVSMFVSKHGSIYNKGNNNTIVIMSHRLNKKLTVGYYNPSASFDNAKICCEQRINRGENDNKNIECHVVEVYIGSKAMKIIGKGQNPEYCKHTDRYILYHNGKYYHIFDNETNKELLRFQSDSAVFF
mgnify:CR=1 FL=1